MNDPLDILLLIPTPTADAYLSDPLLRQTYGPTGVQILASASELESFVGRSLGVGGSVFDPKTSARTQRSLTAVALATNLERAGLRWACIDPGSQKLSYWRDRLQHYRSRRPRCVAISTTYFVTADWLQGLIQMIRAILPDTTVVAGGYMYGTASREFLALNADLLCVGEGEVRLPQIVRALRDRTPLTGIAGLYLREQDGSLRYTGPAEPLDLRALPLPDWTLAATIDPPVDLDRDSFGIGVETQRGCVFKCQFCTFRTLTAPNALDPEQAVEAIFNTRTVRHGHILLADATATFPRDRWTRILELLAKRGGSPHPIWAFARVSDLSPENVALMVKANIGATFIGQESGDQRILSAMRKGTHLSQVKPAVAALAHSGIHTTFGFIHGFPSETAESMQATRDLICTLNDGFEDDPVVYQYVLAPFAPQDLASVAHQENLQRQAVPAKVAIEQTLTTFMAAARIPHAPASDYIGAVAADASLPFLPGATPAELFRWTKLLQRGVGIFLERNLEGTPPDLAELRRIRDGLLAPMAPAQRLEQAAVARLARQVRTRALQRLYRELDAEDQAGTGPMTRLLLAGSALRDSRSLGYAREVWRTSSPATGTASVAVESHIDELARQLVADGLDLPRRWRERHRARVSGP